MPKAGNDQRNPQSGSQEEAKIKSSSSIITRIKDLMGIGHVGSDGAESYSGEIRIKILQPLAAAYGLSDNVGDEIEINAKQASVMIASGHAEIVE